MPAARLEMIKSQFYYMAEKSLKESIRGAAMEYCRRFRSEVCVDLQAADNIVDN